MSATWFTSDLHFGHERIIELSHRPFGSIQEHDEALVANWNKLVKEDDIVWVLGDLAIESKWAYALELVSTLNGRKRLVTGNHDRCWVGKSDAVRYMPEYLKQFEIVTPWARAKLGPTKVVLSHFPYNGDHTREDRFAQYRLPIGETPIVHGHTHSIMKTDKPWLPHHLQTSATLRFVHQIHVGVDAWDYKPVADYELAKFLT